MKKLLSLLLALTMLLALAACGAPKETPPEDAGEPSTGDLTDLDYIKEKGNLIIGYTVYEPMNYTDAATNKFTGFDTELARLVCEKLGVTPEFVEINWDAKILELDAKQIDCIWNGMTITEKMQENAAVTNPYVKNAQVILMKADAAYTDTASLLGKSVVAEQGSAGQKTIEEDANLKQASFVAKKKQTDCLIEVKAGTADAAVLDLTLAKTMTGEGTSYSDLKIMDRLGEEEYGIAFRKGSNTCAAVNEILAELMGDGSMEKLAEQYGLDLAAPVTAE